ncbi:MAG: Mut7-C RNAse domain-containing protein [candidate division KSB1 bacterium]|nr:Mut7-C RNAse domain-containing protein [candidate division KSB1 bacterium]MDZ7333976.1 Mut7-C RNAse domain-containing protein [candidate division KSB1 bacterium]MDZ7357984.1 Mut7-C RNAse domain-containing protein [candidate division KSB1 bacterium]MDZ7399961.1 Mut7-C RNAse domain-containing protein [candidate division KSB1 bacterium]
MNFIADVMLGRLAKWLRILGYDTLYDSQATDDDLFFRAHQEKRILLTRDANLAGRMNPQFCLFITEADVRNQVKQVIDRFHLDTESFVFTRCTICNELVAPISRELTVGRIPEFVYQSIHEFYYCQRCDKIYWPGSHIKHVRELLAQLKKD